MEPADALLEHDNHRVQRCVSFECLIELRTQCVDYSALILDQRDPHFVTYFFARRAPIACQALFLFPMSKPTITSSTLSGVHP